MIKAQFNKLSVTESLMLESKNSQQKDKNLKSTLQTSFSCRQKILKGPI